MDDSQYKHREVHQDLVVMKKNLNQRGMMFGKAVIFTVWCFSYFWLLPIRCRRPRSNHPWTTGRGDAPPGVTSGEVQEALDSLPDKAGGEVVLPPGPHFHPPAHRVAPRFSDLARFRATTVSAVADHALTARSFILGEPVTHPQTNRQPPSSASATCSSMAIAASRTVNSGGSPARRGDPQQRHQPCRA